MRSSNSFDRTDRRRLVILKGKEMEPHQKASVSQTFLTQEQFDRIMANLVDLAQKLQVMAILLVDGTGRILAQQMGKGWKGSRLEIVSNLTAGQFSASNELALLLGEAGRFKMVLHEGEKRNMFVCAVDSDHFLIVIFETGTALGMIRLFTKRTVEQLIPILSQPVQNPEKEIFNSTFESLLDDALDRSLKEK